MSTRIRRKGRGAIAVALFAGFIQPWAFPACAGEMSTPAMGSTTSHHVRPHAPGMEVNVHVLEPGLLPAATELEDRLLYHLRHLPHLLWPVLAGTGTGSTANTQFLLDVQLDPVRTFPVRELSPRPPFLHTGEAAALFHNRIPLQARITVLERGRERVVARTIVIAQSTGFTITAGTTKPAADLMAEKIVHYLKTQRRQGGFLSSR